MTKKANIQINIIAEFQTINERAEFYKKFHELLEKFDQDLQDIDKYYKRITTHELVSLT